MSNRYETKFGSINEIEPHTAPDGLQVREIADVTRGGVAEFRVPGRYTGAAIQHRTVAEIWVLTVGDQVEVWISGINDGKPISVRLGDYFVIPLMTPFQVRNLGSVEANFLALTMPPFPGKEEVELVKGYWKPTSAN